MAVYQTGEMLRTEGRLLDASRPIEARDEVRAFLDYGQSHKGWGSHRQYYYSVRLRITLGFLGDKFLKPDPDAIKKLISDLKNKGNNDRTVTDYLDAYKRFLKWKEYAIGKNLARAFEFKASKNGKRPEDLVTPDEVQRLMDHCTNDRDRALISLLYDSGCRISELLTLKKPDVKFDNQGMMLSVMGKTGYRQVYVLGKSVPLLKKWLQSHPGKNNNDYVFCQIGDPKESMSYAFVRKSLRNAAAKAGITKRIHPHLFRHTRASILATQITEAPLESQMGWIHGSKQSQTYVHLSGDQQKNAILKAYGLLKENKQLDTDLKACPGCGQQIPLNADYCPFCYVQFPNGGQQTISQLQTGLMLELDKFRSGIELQKTNVRINGADFPESDIKIDKSVIDLIVNQIMERLKKEQKS